MDYWLQPYVVALHMYFTITMKNMKLNLIGMDFIFIGFSYDKSMKTAYENSLKCTYNALLGAIIDVQTDRC